MTPKVYTPPFAKEKEQQNSNTEGSFCAKVKEEEQQNSNTEGCGGKRLRGSSVHLGGCLKFSEMFQEECWGPWLAVHALLQLAAARLIIKLGVPV